MLLPPPNIRIKNSSTNPNRRATDVRRLTRQSLLQNVSNTSSQSWLDMGCHGDEKLDGQYVNDDDDDDQLLMLHHQQQFTNTYSIPSDDTGAPFSCNRCGRSYRYIKTRNRHMRHECGVGKHFACVLCGHRTQRSDRLLTHIRSQHPNFARDMPTRRWTRHQGPVIGFETAAIVR